MPRFTITNIRHASAKESHATIRIDNRDYPCVATSRLIDPRGGRYCWVVQHQFEGAMLEVRDERLTEALNAMGYFIVEEIEILQRWRTRHATV